jgi:hypothetical protein
VLGYRNGGTLYIYYELIEEISSTFGLDESESELLIGRWVSDRNQLEVTNTHLQSRFKRNVLAIETN